MNSLKIGTVLVVVGCFLCLVSTKIGIVAMGLGALIIMVGEDKTEKPVGESKVTEEPHVRFVGNQAYLLDKENNVIGVSQLPGTDKKQLR